MPMEFPNPNWTGDTTVQILDNSGGSPLILDLNDPWTARVTISVQDPTNTLAGQFEVHLFAESYGPACLSRTSVRSWSTSSPATRCTSSTSTCRPTRRSSAGRR